MMIDEKKLAAAKAALASLDLSAENTRIAALDAEIERLDRAKEKADDQRGVVQEALRELANVDGMAVADALLAGQDARTAADHGRTEQELRDELNALREGMNDLDRRRSIARREIDEIRSAARSRAGQCLAPLTDAIRADMAEAAETIAEGYAAIGAIQIAAGTVGLVELAAKQAIRGVMGMERLIQYKRTVPVPEDVLTALANMHGKGEALPVRIVEQVSTP